MNCESNLSHKCVKASYYTGAGVSILENSSALSLVFGLWSWVLVFALSPAALVLTYCLLLSAVCRLPSAFCLVLPAVCRLPSAFCFRPSAFLRYILLTHLGRGRIMVLQRS